MYCGQERRKNVANKLRYFVSYAFDKGFGRCEMFLEEAIESVKDIEEVEKHICERNGLKHIVIINFQKF